MQSSLHATNNSSTTSSDEYDILQSFCTSLGISTDQVCQLGHSPGSSLHNPSQLLRGPAVLGVICTIATILILSRAITKLFKHGPTGENTAAASRPAATTHTLQAAVSVPSPNNSVKIKPSVKLKSSTSTKSAKFSKLPYVLDTGATCCMSPDPSHFIDLQLYSDSKTTKLSGITAGHGCKILGKGTLAFQLRNNKGNWQTVLVPDSLYVPDLQQALISPQHWMSTDKSIHFQMHNQHWRIH